MPLAGRRRPRRLGANEREKRWAIHRYIQNRFGRVSAERVLSGPGLENIYLALADYHGRNVSPLSAAKIGQRALSGYRHAGIRDRKPVF